MRSMTRKKNGFLTFIFSLLPGAAEMYMGFMKMGVSLMGLFFAAGCLSNLGAGDTMVFGVLLLWFYSFFHAHNLAGLPDEVFYEVKDEYLIPFKGKEFDDMKLTKTFRNIAAAVLIIIGSSILLRSGYSLLSPYLPEEVRRVMNDTIFYYVPKFAVGIAIIILGIYMIRGKKKELERGGLQHEKDS